MAWDTLRLETADFSGSYTMRGKVEQLMYTSDLSSTYRLNIASIANRSTDHMGFLAKKDIGLFLEIPCNLHIGVGDMIEYTSKVMRVIDFPLK